MLSATAAAFVGICGANQFNSAQVSGGMNYISNAIAAIVVGGTVPTGGSGPVIGIFFGRLTFAVVSQGIYFTRFDRSARCQAGRPCVVHRERGQAARLGGDLHHPSGDGCHGRRRPLRRADPQRVATDFKKGERSRENITDLMAGGETIAGLEATFEDDRGIRDGQGPAAA